MNTKTEKPIQPPRPKFTYVQCPNCSGYGSKGFNRLICPSCKGVGVLQVPIEKEEVENGQ